MQFEAKYLKRAGDEIPWSEVYKHIDNTNPHAPTSSRNAWGGVSTTLPTLIWHKETIQPDDPRFMGGVSPASMRDVKRYAKHYQKWKDHPHYKGIPAIVLQSRDGRFIVQDGAHRLAACMLLGIPVDAYIGTQGEVRSNDNSIR